MESRSLADGALHPDAAAMRVDDMPRDRQPEARAARFARPGGVYPVESLENSLQVGLRNADARVGHRECYVVAVGAGLHFNLPAGRRVLHRVVEQILQHFAQLRAIPAHGRRILRQVDMNLRGPLPWH